MAELKKIFKRSIFGYVYIVLYRLIFPEKIDEHIEKIYNSKVHIFHDSRFSVFFGYNDKTPFSGDSTKLLANLVEASDQDLQSEGKDMKIGFYNISLDNEKSNNFNLIDTTTTWSWQQGCMLQWNPKNPTDEIVYNKMVNGKFGAVVFSLKEKKIIKLLNHPIYSLSPSGKHAGTLNFSRLGRLRPGYGYRMLNDHNKNANAPLDDGLFLIELETGEANLIISLYELAKDADKLNYENYINHISFSPDGGSLVFFHIWMDSNNKKNIRFIHYNLNTKEKIVLEDEMIVSHFCWRNEHSIMVTCKKIKETRWRYLLYEINDEVKSSDLGIPLQTDGHPMQSPMNPLLYVSDSRLDKRRSDKIFLFSEDGKKVFEVAKFFFPFGYDGPVRCDLHPRWDRRNKFICADIVYKNRRSMAIVELDEIFQKN